MANVYTNYKANLSTTALTTVYTVGSATSSVIKSIRVSNQDTENNCNISLFLVDSDGTSYPLEIDRNIQAKRSQELLATGNMDQGSTDSSIVASSPLVLT